MKELVVYIFKIKNKFFLLIISNLFGWDFFQFRSSYVIVKYIIFSKIYGVFFFKSFLSYYKFFIQYLLLKGMGYKSSTFFSSIILKLNKSHRIVYNLKKNVKFFFKNKQSLCIKSSSLFLLKQIIFFLEK